MVGSHQISTWEMGLVLSIGVHSCPTIALMMGTDEGSSYLEVLSGQALAISKERFCLQLKNRFLILPSLCHLFFLNFEPSGAGQY